MYLVDGYNFLFYLRKEFRDIPLAKQRDDLIDALGQMLNELGLQMHLVFDSQTQASLYAPSYSIDSLTISYAPEGSCADRYILELTELHPAQTIVVSSDTALTRQADRLGAKTVTIEKFLSMIANKRVCARKKRGKQIPHISLQESQRWLEIFDRRWQQEQEKPQ